MRCSEMWRLRSQCQKCRNLQSGIVWTMVSAKNFHAYHRIHSTAIMFQRADLFLFPWFVLRELNVISRVVLWVLIWTLTSHASLFWDLHRQMITMTDSRTIATSQRRRLMMASDRACTTSRVIATNQLAFSVSFFIVNLRFYFNLWLY